MLTQKYYNKKQKCLFRFLPQADLYVFEKPDGMILWSIATLLKIQQRTRHLHKTVCKNCIFYLIYLLVQ